MSGDVKITLFIGNYLYSPCQETDSLIAHASEVRMRHPDTVKVVRMSSYTAHNFCVEQTAIPNGIQYAAKLFGR